MQQQRAVFSALARILYQTDALDIAATGIMEVVSPLLGAEAGVFWLLHNSGEKFDCAAIWHTGGQRAHTIATEFVGSTLPLRAGAVEMAMEIGTPRCIGEEAIAALHIGNDITTQYGVEELCLVPVSFAEHRVGMFEFFCTTPIADAEQWTETIQEVAQQVAMWFVRIRREQGMRATLEREQKNNALKKQFMSVLCHDFRTPFTAILSSVDLLEYLSDTLSAEQRNEYFGFIRESVERMTALLDYVRLIRKIDEQQIIFRPTSVNVSLFCDKLVQEMQSGDSGQGELQCIVQGNGEEIQVDEQLLWTMCTHLLSNAFKYSPAGANVVWCVTYTDTELEIEVRDTGIGIPQEEQGKLFTPFFRAANVGTVSGVGLGLFIVRHAVELHGGVIHVVSNQGEGTVFTIRLPLTS